MDPGLKCYNGIVFNQKGSLKEKKKNIMKDAIILASKKQLKFF